MMKYYLLFLLLIGFAYADTGGTITTNATHTIHTFLSGGTYASTSSKTINILVIAGGGSGGSGYGAGGGAGEYNETTLSVGIMDYTVVIGGGGISGGGALLGTNGTNTTFSNSSTRLITAIGGSTGSTNDYAASCYVSCGALYTGGGVTSPSLAGHGYASGSSATSAATGYPTGGGGGAASTGFATETNQIGGDGGQGKNSSINGSIVCRGGGGGGNSRTSTAGHASCGGGAGGSGAQNGFDATANTGGGGGGAGTTTRGGAGGSGIVIISYLGVSGSSCDCPAGASDWYVGGCTITTNCVLGGKNLYINTSSATLNGGNITGLGKMIQQTVNAVLRITSGTVRT